MNDLIVGFGGGGGKGGGGGSARTATEAPNNLKSIQYAQIIDVISEGEIGGLVNGAASIYLDDVPLTEFNDATWEFRTGTQTQSITNVGLSGAKTTIEVGALVRNALVGGASGEITQTINASAFDAGLASIDVTLGVPTLTNQDTSNGDVNGSSVSFQILVAVAGGSDTVYHDNNISGKCTSMYNASYNVPLSQFSRSQYPLRITVRRTSADSTTMNVQNQLYWSSYTLNYPTKLNFPNTALATLSIDSEHFTNIPSRSFEIYGIKVKIPTNYNPITKVYTGSWDGTFKVDWTDNPAWIYYDLATDTRYGIGEYITEDRIDKWELYTISKYCDELVPNGYGGKEPRFTCNTYIQTQDEAFKVLSDLASIFRGMQYWAGGYFSVTADTPKDAIAEFTSANVIDGVFNYSGSSLKTRHTAVKVIWNDPTDAYKQKVEYVEANGFVHDQSNPNYAFKPINSYGIVQTDLAAIGCASRGQANRAGRWLLYSELYETETVSFKTGIENAILMPGTIIKTADPFRQGKRMGGRVLERSSDVTLKLDNSIDPGAYTLSFAIAVSDPNTKVNKSYLISYTGTISLDTNGDSIFTSGTGALHTNITSNSIWVATLSGSLEPELWRVISITQDDEITATITALEYHPDKFNAIEQGLLLEARPTSQIDYGKPSTPIINTSSTRDNIFDLSYSEVKTTLSSNITNAITTIPCVSTTGFTSYGYIRIDNELIQYTGITATSFTGAIRGIVGLLTPSSAHLSNSTITQVTKISSGTGWVTEYLFYQSPSVVGTAAALSWTANSANYEIKYKPILANATAWESKVTNVPFIEFKPIEPGLYDIEIVAINTLGRRSEPLRRTIKLSGKSAPPIDVSGFIATKSATGIVLTWNDNTSSSLPFPDLDLAGYEVRELYYTALPAYMQEVNNQVAWAAGVTNTQKTTLWDSASKATDGLISTTTFTDPSVTSNKYNVFLIKAKDDSGNYSNLPSICGVKINPPQQITNASISINGTDLVISWTPPVSDIGISYYTVTYNNGTSNQTITCQTPELRKKLWFTGYEVFDIVAYDAGGSYSIAKSVEITVGVLPSVQSLTNRIEGENYVLSWLAPNTSGAAPVEYYELRNDSNWGHPINKITTTSSTGFSAKVDWAGDKLIYIAAKDTSGTYGTSTSISISSPIPGQVGSFIPTVVDNNVLFSWTTPSTGVSLPIVEYEVRKGSTWDSSVLIGTKSGLFTTNFETIAGTYTYWIAAINSAGTYGTPRSCTAVVNQPPDYILATNYFSDFINKFGTNGSISSSNAHIGIDNKLILPINTTQTWISHFTSTGYDQVQDFIDAGYTSFMEPEASTGYYQEVIDLGSVIAGSTVSIAVNETTISGTPSITYEVSASSDNITYTTVSSDLINYFTQFRYIKVKIIVTGGILKFNTLNIRIDVKQKTTSGVANCVYSHSTGTQVYLTDDKLVTGTKVFKDVISLNLTPNIGCTNSSGVVINTVSAIYDFVDAPDPLSFKILLYNSTNGERLSGSCSYTIRGV